MADLLLNQEDDLVKSDATKDDDKDEDQEDVNANINGYINELLVVEDNNIIID